MTWRSCVDPKLVSKGWSSRIRNSRISICLINTRCSRHKEIFTPLVLPLEAGDEVVVRKVLQELFAHTLLHILGRFETLFLESLKIFADDHFVAGFERKDEW